MVNYSGCHKVDITHTVVGWYTVVTQRSSHSGHNTKVEWSSHGVHHKVRQLVRKMSNFHKSLRFVIYCAAYGAERLFSLVFCHCRKFCYKIISCSNKFFILQKELYLQFQIELHLVFKPLISANFFLCLNRSITIRRDVLACLLQF